MRDSRDSRNADVRKMQRAATVLVAAYLVACGSGTSASQPPNADAGDAGAIQQTDSGDTADARGGQDATLMDDGGAHGSDAGTSADSTADAPSDVSTDGVDDAGDGCTPPDPNNPPPSMHCGCVAAPAPGCPQTGRCVWQYCTGNTCSGLACGNECVLVASVDGGC